MGIKGLTKLLSDAAAGSIREREGLKTYNGRKVAIDASMAIYQFLVAVRSAGAGGGASAQLTNEDGEVTSHLQGMFHRTIRMLENGIKPVYVFDGKPPDLKAGELLKRKALKADAEAKLKEATETGTAEEVDRYSRRTVRMTERHKEDCKELLALMGVPVVEAACEAEAQCAAMCREGLVWAVASEDMDALTFRAPVLLRRLTFSEARKQPILEIRAEDAMSGLGLSYDQFVDLCILCGCDYVPSIRGIGPKKALKLVKDHSTLERIFASLESTRYAVPDELAENFARARELFKEPEVAPVEAASLSLRDPDEAGLIAFLVEKNGFSEDRVRNGIKKIEKARKAGTQRRMDSFFKPAAGAGAGAGAAGAKRGAPKGGKAKASAPSKRGRPAKKK